MESPLTAISNHLWHVIEDLLHHLLTERKSMHKALDRPLKLKAVKRLEGEGLLRRIGDNNQKILIRPTSCSRHRDAIVKSFHK